MNFVRKIRKYFVNKLFFSPTLDLQIKSIKINDNKRNSIINKYELSKKDFKQQLKKQKFAYPANRTKISDDLIRNESEIGDWLGNVIIIGDKYYRGINKNSVEKFIEFYETGIYSSLIEKGYFVPFVFSNLYSERYPIILSLEQIIPKKCIDWDLLENKKALLFCSQLQLLCKDNGFMLTDNHIYNIVYYKDKPIYIDHGSLDTFDAKKKDYSLIISLVYRLIFTSFSNSFFFNRINSPRLNVWANNKNELNTFEYISARNAFLKFHKKHSSKCVYEAAKNILIKQIVNPWDVEILFEIF